MQLMQMRNSQWFNEQFQQKWEPVLRPELRLNKKRMRQHLRELV